MERTNLLDQLGFGDVAGALGVGPVLKRGWLEERILLAKDDISQDVNHQSSFANTIGRRENTDVISRSSDHLDEPFLRSVGFEETRRSFSRLLSSSASERLSNSGLESFNKAEYCGGREESEVVAVDS
jgi:hypothetical protein